MQGKQTAPSIACTAWLVTGAIAPLGGFVFRPLALVGAIVVLFGIVIAAATVDH